MYTIVARLPMIVHTILRSRNNNSKVCCFLDVTEDDFKSVFTTLKLVVTLLYQFFLYSVRGFYIIEIWMESA